MNFSKDAFPTVSMREVGCWGEGVRKVDGNRRSRKLLCSQGVSIGKFRACLLGESFLSAEPALELFQDLVRGPCSVSKGAKFIMLHGGFWDLNSLGHSVSLVGIPGGEDRGVGAGMELDPNSQSLEDIIACKLRVGSRISKMVC